MFDHGETGCLCDDILPDAFLVRGEDIPLCRCVAHVYVTDGHDRAKWNRLDGAREGRIRRCPEGRLFELVMSYCAEQVGVDGWGLDGL